MAEQDTHRDAKHDAEGRPAVAGVADDLRVGVAGSLVEVELDVDEQKNAHNDNDESSDLGGVHFFAAACFSFTLACQSTVGGSLRLLMGAASSPLMRTFLSA